MINNAGSTLTNFQIPFLVYTGPGTSTSNTIYLNSNSKSNLDDLRFTNANSDVIYDYWLESATSPFIVWVKVPSIPSGNSTIRVYYGNDFATAYSNGTNTFDFFDDFDTLNSSIWTSYGTVSVANSRVTINRSGSDSGIYTKNVMYSGKPFITEVKYQHPSRYRNRTYLTTSSGGESPTGYDYGIFDSSIYWNGFTGTNLSTNTWYIIRWVDLSNNYYWEFYNETYTSQVLTRNRGSTVNNTGYLTLRGSESDSSDLVIDFVRVRKYASPLPIDSTWSGEIRISSLITKSLDYVLMLRRVKYVTYSVQVTPNGITATLEYQAYSPSLLPTLGAQFNIMPFNRPYNMEEVHDTYIVTAGLGYTVCLRDITLTATQVKVDVELEWSDT